MADINAALVKQLRDATGAGMMECKAALVEAKGNLDEPTTLLRKRGLAQATKKAGRSTNEGLIGSYIHMGGRIGVLVEGTANRISWRAGDFQNPERDRDAYRRGQPTVRPREDVPPDCRPRAGIYRGQMEVRTKPVAVIDKISTES